MSNVFIRDRYRVANGNQTIGEGLGVAGIGIVLTNDVNWPRRARIAFDNLVIPITAALDYASLKVAEFGAGDLGIHATHGNYTITRDGTGVLAATDVRVALGSIAAAGTSFPATQSNVKPNLVFTTDALTDSVNDTVTPAADVLIDQSAAPNIFLNVSAAGMTVDGSVTLDGYMDLYYTSYGER